MDSATQQLWEYNNLCYNIICEILCLIIVIIIRNGYFFIFSVHTITCSLSMKGKYVQLPHKHSTQLDWFAQTKTKISQFWECHYRTSSLLLNSCASPSSISHCTIHFDLTHTHTHNTRVLSSLLYCYTCVLPTCACTRYLCVYVILPEIYLPLLH